MKKIQTSFGFTLIELLVVISIIGTLATLLIINFVGVRNRASDATLKNNLRQLKTALRIYYNDYQQYPDDDGAGIMEGCGTSGDTACSAGGTFSAGSGPTVYMSDLPASFTYTATADQESYVLSVELNNASDDDLENSATACGQTYISGDLTYYVCSD